MRKVVKFFLVFVGEVKGEEVGGFWGGLVNRCVTLFTVRLGCYWG